MPRTRPEAGDVPPQGDDLETTAELLSRARQGDERARNRLCERVLPHLRAFARRRVPSRIRDLTDTDDLVQETLLRALKHMDEFEPRSDGAFFAYLRRILVNRITDEVRRVARRPGGDPVREDLADPGRTPLELAIGRETLEAYEAALATLPEDQCHAVILRVDFGCTHQEVADILGRPSSNAARMLVARGLVALAERMGGQR